MIVPTFSFSVGPMTRSSFRFNWADLLVLMGLGGAIAGIGFQDTGVTAV